MLFGTAEGEYLVSGVREAMPWLLRSIRRHAVRNDLDQTRNLDLCSETPHGRRRQVVCQLGVWVGRKAPRLINQQAQAHALTGARCAGLLGQRAPAFIRLPVRDHHLAEPPQRLALDHSACAPGQV
jgi:hypothetical protein